MLQINSKYLSIVSKTQDIIVSCIEHLHHYTVLLIRLPWTVWRRWWNTTVWYVTTTPPPVVCTHLLKQINARDQSGQTALHRSAQQGLVNVCQFLLQHGADPLLVTRDGHSVADMANVSVLKLLQGQYDLYSLNHWPFPEQWYQCSFVYF